MCSKTARQRHLNERKMKQGTLLLVVQHTSLLLLPGDQMHIQIFCHEPWHGVLSGHVTDILIRPHVNTNIALVYDQYDLCCWQLPELLFDLNRHNVSICRITYHTNNNQQRSVFQNSLWTPTNFYLLFDYYDYDYYHKVHFVNLYRQEWYRNILTSSVPIEKSQYHGCEDCFYILEHEALFQRFWLWGIEYTKQQFVDYKNNRTDHLFDYLCVYDLCRLICDYDL